MSHLFGDDFITLAYLRRYPDSARERAWHGMLVNIETTSGVWRESGKGYTHAGSPDAWVLPFGEALWQIISLGPDKNARLLRVDSSVPVMSIGAGTLLPCPFCGVELYACSYSGGKIRHAHQVNGCVLDRKIIQGEAQEAAWNTRAPASGKQGA